MSHPMLEDLDLAPNGPSASARLAMLLGPADDRYFAAGYRTALVHLIPTSIALGDHMLAGAFGISYPDGWSRDAHGRPREAHVTSVDAVRLPILLIEHLVDELGFINLRRSSLASLKMRAKAQAWPNLSRVPVRLNVATPRAGLGVVHARVANIDVELEFSGKGWESLRFRNPLPRSKNVTTVYGSAFRSTQATPIHLGFTESNRTLVTRWEHTNETASARLSPGGVEADKWPGLTAMDYLTTMGQTTQAAAYSAAGLTRSEAKNLWMRSISMEFGSGPSSAALPAEVEYVTRLTRDRIHNRHGQRLHDVHVRVDASTGVSATSAMAYVEAEADRD